MRKLILLLGLVLQVIIVLLMWYCYLPKIHLLCKVQLAMNKEFSA